MLTGAKRSLMDFEGVRRMERRITQADGTQARLSGEALWTPSGGSLAYVERGVLQLPEQVPLQAEKRYTWAPDLRIFFPDGRFFHQVPAAGGSVTHWCDPDIYEGLYDFSAWPDFEVSWVVSGPRKAYHMHTIYTRDSA